ncbi:hypothetical protein CAPTEDRAFT_212535, partial [Capitella teleta]
NKPRQPPSLEEEEEATRTLDDDDPKTYRGLVIQFAQSTSLQGVFFIERASHWWSRGLWILIVLTAIGVGTFQSITILQNYLSYGTSTSISISYDYLDFPSITLCNLNPIRYSMLSLADPRMSQLVEDLTPDTDYGGQPGPPSGGGGDIGGGGGGTGGDGGGTGAGPNRTNGSNDDDDSMMMQGDQAKAQQVSVFALATPGDDEMITIFMMIMI